MALDDIRIVLVEPAHPGNVGAVARAMKTMAFTRLVLVRPNRFPSPDADRRAMGAIDILQRTQVVDDLDQAVGDCALVIGCSARSRTFPHAELDPKRCAKQLVEETATGESAALVFGPERTGLANQDLDRCTHQVLIPANQAFSSLNLASAAQIIFYETFVAAHEAAARAAGESAGRLGATQDRSEPPVSQREMEYFFGHLERALDSRGYLEGQMREITMMKLRRLLGRSRPGSGELKLLHTLTRMIHRDGE